MKTLLTATALLFLIPALYAQSEIGRAVTMDGRRIILFDNGTFRYETSTQKWGPGTAVSTDTVQELSGAPIANRSYDSSPYNTKEWRSTRTHFGVYYNPKKWKLKLAHKPPPDEASFHMADTYAGIYTDRLDVDMESWIQSLKLHYKQLDPEAKLVKEEWRTVNGTPLYHMIWNIELNRSRIKLYGYYAVGNGETIQLLVHTPLSVAGDTEPEVYRILSGLHIYKD